MMLQRAVLAVLLAWLALATPLPAAAGSVHPGLEARLAGLPPDELVPVIVELVERAHPASAAAGQSQRRARGRSVVQALREVADRTQPPVRALLAQEQAQGNARRVKHFWIFNGHAAHANEKAIRKLARRHDVKELRLDRTIRAPLPRPSAGRKLANPAWNIEMVRAMEVWAIDAAYSGAGVVIGSFDTGVDGTHPDLAPRYRGNHAISWFDPYGEHATPYDANGHGTHTVGTMVGGELSGYTIGVAPGARWIAAKAWNDAELATASAFHEIFEWFLAPGGDPANAPDVVNNSWGLDSLLCETEFLSDVQAWRAAGIVPVFASGNSGPDPGTVLSPGAYADSFTVGATDFFDEIAFFSSQGPSACGGIMKPNISAPGMFILSTFPGDSYAYLDGTSMAAPHVSGAAAVMLSIAPDLLVEEIEAILVGGAVDLGTPGPDNAFGYGRLDVMASAALALESSGQPVVGVTASVPAAAELGTVPGQFRIRRGGDTTAALTVSYTVSGTAAAGSDYVALPGTATFAPGENVVFVPVTPIDDAIGELDETVIMRLVPDPGYISAPAQAAVTIVSDEVPPDLMVPTMSAPSASGAGATITVGDTTRNAGAGPAEASTTRYYLSSDPALDATDALLAGRAVPALAAGASDAATLSVTIPAGTASGLYWILAKADGADALVETDETNNVQSRTIQVGPDLALSSFSVPSFGAAGQPILVSDTTRNLGAGQAAASTTSFYLSTDTVHDASDVLLGSRAVPSLVAGDSSAASTSLAIPAGTATGNYHVIARADSGDAVGELYENNNTMSRTLAVGPDLQITNVTAPSSGGPGVAIVVGDTTRNLGAGTAGASTTRFHLSSNSLFDAGDVLLGSRAVPALAPNASSIGSTSLTIPAGTPVGTYWILVRADADATIAEIDEANNLGSAIIQVGADLTVSSLSAPADAGAGTAITVADTTRNPSSSPAGATVTAFFLSADATLDAADVLLGSRAVPALAAGDSSSASTSVTLPAGLATGTYYLFARADNDGAITETSESNNTSNRTLRIGPDLVIASLDAPTAAGAGTTIPVTDGTRNSGGGPVAASTTRIYLSANPTLDAGDTVLASRAVPALAAGATNSATASATLPAGLAPGTYWLIAKADADELLAETQEANNLLTRTLTVGVDLTVSSLTAPSTAGAGLAITITDTTRNAGGGTTAATTTAFYLSTDTAFDASDVSLGNRTVPALSSGASSTASTPLTVPAATATGSYYLIARADAGEVVGELSETNNTMSWTLVVGPDLQVSTLTVPTTAGAGSTISVTEATRNAGGGNAAATSTRFYLSADTLLDAADVTLGSRAVALLAPGATSSTTVSLPIPASTTAGNYWLIAKADGDDALPETQEANNVLARAITIGPDLLVASLTVPADGGAGLAITVTDTTRNQSAGGAGASSTTFHLSANPTLDAGDVALGSRAVPALAAGAQDTGSVSLTIPAGTATGTYYLFARADGADAIVETNEANNTLSRTIRIGADLTITAVTGPSTAGAGQSIAIGDTTRNAGGGGAAASSTRFYLSANPTLDAGDVLLGSRAVAALAAGISGTGSITATIPAGTAAGTYWIIARADGDDAVVETQETNNTMTRVVNIGADLAVSSFSVPAAAAAGQTLTITDTTRNQGAGDAVATTTTFYLSTNTTIDAGDIVLASRAIPALAAGASDTASTAVTIPAGTAPGNYYVIARADAGDAVAELYETNNTIYRMVGVGPDLVISNLTAPSPAVAGATINVSVTTRNTGAGAAGASVTRFYLSTNSLIDAADVLLGSRAVPALAAGASDAGAVPITIPAGTTPGTYYVIALADGESAVAETEESNNRLFAIVQVTSP